jgi:hypothetical protein
LFAADAIFDSGRNRRITQRNVVHVLWAKVGADSATLAPLLVDGNLVHPFFSF